MSLNDNLGEIVNAVRFELGYRVYRDENSILPLSAIRGEIFWLFRNIMKRPIIPVLDERYIIAWAAVGTGTGDNLDIELLGEGDYTAIQILPHAVESFPKVFRAGMQAYLEQRQYVTEPQQAIEHAVESMGKLLNPIPKPK